MRIDARMRPSSHTALALATVLILMLSPVLAACSNEDMVNQMTTEEDRAQAIEFVTDLRNGSIAKAEAAMQPELVTKTKDIVPKVTEILKEVPPNFKVIGYQWNNQVTTQGTVDSRLFVLKAGEGRKWVKIDVLYVSRNGGTPKIDTWFVYPFDTDPEVALAQQSKQ